MAYASSGRAGGKAPFHFQLAASPRAPENISVKKSIAAFLAATALACPAITSAQKTASVFGTVADSLHGGWLSGAEVTITGTTRTAVTDSLGRFRFDSVPPGTKQLGVFHPILESLGISIGSHPFKLGSDSAGILVVAVPSGRSLLRQLCNVRPRDKKTGAMIGRVIDPDTRLPVAASHVTFQWTDYEVKEKKTLHLTPHAVVSVTDDAGTFKACGLPIDVSVRMQASRSGIEAPDMEVEIGSVPVITTDIAIRSPDSRSVGAISGRIGDPTGLAVSGTYVGIERTGLSTMTDSTGHFALSGVMTGTQIIVARKIGYSAIAFPVLVTPVQNGSVAYVMSKSVPMLEDVQVLANANVGLSRVGFTQRKGTGLGTFLLAEDIEKQRNPRLSEILGRVSGLTHDPLKGRGFIRSTRDAKTTADQACIRMFIDGTEWIMSSPGYVDEAVLPARIAAIEVYHPLDVPSEYSSLQNCTTILVWTKFKVLKAK
ncbi:MAG: carboxypeptidase regulatory-like domain-containing protein [Gemmatimonadaceae bacterium]|nr:carboxypeptidase regulatory-like domain-containing protein [Gemmatimonadaceae bacterium]